MRIADLHVDLYIKVRYKKAFFLVPKPQLGNALAEKPRLLVRNEKQLEAGLQVQRGVPKPGLGNEG
jgi:hypothetical protein